MFETGVTASRVSRADDETVGVLLVDDNEAWARFIATELETEMGDVTVTVALSANEAMLAFQDGESIDCVVSDYWMPTVDGVELLERLREDRPNLPFILVTGDGSEEIASRAIAAGVTDYVRKDPREDQTAVFANRIERAIDQYRLRRELEESEARYRTVTEQTRDAIVILQDDRIVFWNERAVELAGIEHGTPVDVNFAESLLHPDDRERVRSAIRGDLTEDVEDTLHEARLVPQDGPVRHCEIACQRTTFENAPAALLSIRDVTARTGRERLLARERQLNWTVQRALVDGRTREELETAVCDRLLEHGYDLVWIGDVVDGSVRYRAIAGESTYLDELDGRADVSGDDGEPSVRATRTGSIEHVTDFEALFPTDWQRLVLDSGYRSGAAFPLSHDRLSYGVLGVYHGEVDQFDENERDLLGELAATLSFAINHVETRHTLGRARRIDAELVLTDPSYYLADVIADSSSDAPNARITVQGTHAVGDETIQYVTVDGIAPETFRTALEDHPHVGELSAIGGADATRFRVNATSMPPESLLASSGATVRSTTITADRVRLRFELPERDRLRTAVESIEAHHGPVSVEFCVDVDRTERDDSAVLVDTSTLTEKQASALGAAYHHEYFEQPRVHSATDIAESLDVTHSTYLQHLRVAQKKVFEQLFG